MQFIQGFLTLLGEHFILVLVGCAEFLVAVFFFCSFIGKKIHRKSNPAENDFRYDILNSLQDNTQEVFILVRQKDKFPVYSIGNLPNFLGLSFQTLREDITALKRVADDSKTADQFWDICMEWDGKKPLTTTMHTKDGKWMDVKVERTSDNLYDLITIRNATDVFNQFEIFEQKLQNAEDANALKTNFLYRMSHEIRTPMNGIMGMLTLAKEVASQDSSETSNAICQYLSKTEELSTHLLSLINDILDMSRIEAGKVELESKSFSLHALGERLYDMFAKVIEEKGVSYIVNFEDFTIDWVLGDELRLSQILINFLSNAIKFTTEGEITLTFRQMMIQNGKADLMICVHDTGIGMTPEFVNKIFRPFEQGSTEITRNYGGTGLGMAITDNLVRLMDGEIVVKSTPGVGSDFSVFLCLPIAKNQTQNSSKKEIQKKDDESADSTFEHSFAGRHILLAEDNEINALIATEILEQMGAIVETAENGKTAVEKFAASVDGFYDLILMDVQMPVMNGREAAMRIRALDRSDAKDVLIYALSADAFLEDERASVESGMNGHFAKPVDFRALEHTIGKYMKGERSNSING